MHLFLWILQIALAIKLFSISWTHGLRQEQPAMQEALLKMGKSARLLLMVISCCALLGSVGLVVPAATGCCTGLVPATAAGIAALMLASIFLHVKYREKPKILAGVILFIMAAFICYGRRVLAPF